MNNDQTISLPIGSVLSVNLGRAMDMPYTSAPAGTGIDKRPVAHPVMVTAPGRKGVAGSGLAGDDVCDLRHHGGDDQAVYAYAREDLDSWQAEIGRPLPGGSFGENLTTTGIDISNAVVGEQWAVGDTLVLEVSDPRIPCRTFAGFLAERGWIKRFTERAEPGTYLRVITSGEVAAGDRIQVLHRPDHGITVATAFRAFTTEPELLASLVGVEGLSPEAKSSVAKRVPISLDADQ
ncbi:MOSC domain-containing protein YiiM [Nakamurella sp. UYEF19]|uniref:MOSC domain-containing protein n=1 Tax=Nakamurella sp. UYEF19 TaxID=1756392 RepID=UPI00339AFFAD